MSFRPKGEIGVFAVNNPTIRNPCVSSQPRPIKSHGVAAEHRFFVFLG